jgi:glycerol kinase
MYPWQKDFLDKMTQYKGKGLLQVTGRHSSKTAFNRLYRDIFSTKLERIEVSETKLHGARIYSAKPIGGWWIEMELWCTERFGPPGTIWNETIERWYMNDQKFFFRNEQDLTMFLLKWR